LEPNTPALSLRLSVTSWKTTSAVSMSATAPFSASSSG
jgi:hypothetical protein